MTSMRWSNGCRDPVAVDSAELLAVWNLAQDAAASLGQNLADRDELSDRAYEKLLRRGGPQWIEHLDDSELTGRLDSGGNSVVGPIARSRTRSISWQDLDARVTIDQEWTLRLKSNGQWLDSVIP